MTEETKTTKIEEAFDGAWDGEPNPGAFGKLELARRFFTRGAQAFSTMPLCDHGVAIWGVEFCEPCAEAGSPPPFPGYNRPFQAVLPEGMTEGDIEDLKVEREAMRLSLLQVLVKVGALDPEGVNAPWDGVRLIHFVGLWLSNALPFVRTPRALTLAMGDLDQRVKAIEAALEAVTSPDEDDS